MEPDCHLSQRRGQSDSGLPGPAKGRGPIPRDNPDP